MNSARRAMRARERGLRRTCLRTAYSAEQPAGYRNQRITFRGSKCVFDDSAVYLSGGIGVYEYMVAALRGAPQLYIRTHEPCIPFLRIQFATGRSCRSHPATPRTGTSCSVSAEPRQPHSTLRALCAHHHCNVPARGRTHLGRTLDGGERYRSKSYPGRFTFHGMFAVTTAADQ